MTFGRSSGKEYMHMSQACMANKGLSQPGRAGLARRPSQPPPRAKQGGKALRRHSQSRPQHLAPETTAGAISERAQGRLAPTGEA
jgi:hypothetical protein